jgi:hypothetical protein
MPCPGDRRGQLGAFLGRSPYAPKMWLSTTPSQQRTGWLPIRFFVGYLAFFPFDRKCPPGPAALQAGPLPANTLKDLRLCKPMPCPQKPLRTCGSASRCPAGKCPQGPAALQGDALPANALRDLRPYTSDRPPASKCPQGPAALQVCPLPQKARPTPGRISTPTCDRTSPAQPGTKASQAAPLPVTAYAREGERTGGLRQDVRRQDVSQCGKLTGQAGA